MLSLRRIRALLTALTLCAALTSTALHAASAERPLNVLFITVDDMNADSPGWMGHPLKLTPQLDAFAATSHRFINQFVTAPICQPSRSALMTGRVPHRNGALGFEPIRPDVPTLVTLLRAQGYYTAALNKIPHMMPESCFPWDGKFTGSGKNPALLGRQVRDAITSARTAQKPFFINCNITDPHRPFYGADARPNAAKKAAKKKSAPATSPSSTSPSTENANVETEGTVVPVAPADVPIPAFLEDLPDIRRELAQYYSSIKRLDLAFAAALQSLRDSGEADRTIVLFMSDHGMSFPFSKATVYFNGTWSPLLLRWPDMGAPQQRLEFTSSVDVLPTLLELLRVPAPAGLDGRSLLPLLRGETQPDRDHVFTHVNSVSSGVYFPQRCVRTRDHALLFHAWAAPDAAFRVEAMSGLSYRALADAAATDPRLQPRLDQLVHGTPLAFYDLRTDPGERRNEIANPAYRAEIDRLKKLLLAHLERTQDPQLANYRTALAGQPINFKADRLPRKKGQ